MSTSLQRFVKLDKHKTKFNFYFIFIFLDFFLQKVQHFEGGVGARPIWKKINI